MVAPAPSPKERPAAEPRRPRVTPRMILLFSAVLAVAVVFPSALRLARRVLNPPAISCEAP